MVAREKLGNCSSTAEPAGADRLLNHSVRKYAHGHLHVLVTNFGEFSLVKMSCSVYFYPNAYMSFYN